MYLLGRAMAAPYCEVAALVDPSMGFPDDGDPARQVLEAAIPLPQNAAFQAGDLLCTLRGTAAVTQGRRH